MTAQALPALASGDPSAWEQALYAFLVEKGNRSGSKRTVESYGRMLWPFFAERGLTPDRVKPADVLSFVHGIGRSGRTPSATTVGARIACLSSFYRFLIRMGLVVSNPTDAIERPRATQSVARGYSADEVRRLLAVVPNTVAGRRDRALLLTFILTGRRRTEVISLTAGDITVEGDTVFYAYRGKGGKRGRRELPRPAFEALCATLADAGLELGSMDMGASLWQAGAGPRGVTGSTFYSRFRRYLRLAGLAPTGIHVLRHSAAKLRRDAGESIEDVSAFLDHSSLAVTTVYLRRLEGQEDRAWREVAQAIGVGG
ncbi:MAG: tyrosine-type recombinase/integrase [Candidatus Limnocylindrales bacterium]|jgi:integrase/recombinase XerC